MVPEKNIDLGSLLKSILCPLVLAACAKLKMVLATGGFPKHFWFQFRHLYLQNVQEKEL